MKNPGSFFKEDSDFEPIKGEDKKLILVVEDDADSRDLLCMILKKLGYETVSFACGEGVLESINDMPVCLAMLDIMMPKVDGYELLKQMRSSTKFSEIPIFMVTARDQDEEIISGYTRGADYYIMKPYSSRQIEYGINLYLIHGGADPES
jgi:DNA-binding response OmpR family regulator